MSRDNKLLKNLSEQIMDSVIIAAEGTNILPEAEEVKVGMNTDNSLEFYVRVKMKGQNERKFLVKVREPKRGR